CFRTFSMRRWLSRACIEEVDSLSSESAASAPLSTRVSRVGCAEGAEDDRFFSESRFRVDEDDPSLWLPGKQQDINRSMTNGWSTSGVSCEFQTNNVVC